MNAGRSKEFASLWYGLTVVMLMATTCTCLYATLIFFEPRHPLNPLPPDTRTPFPSSTPAPTATPLLPTATLPFGPAFTTQGASPNLQPATVTPGASPTVDLTQAVIGAPTATATVTGTLPTATPVPPGVTPTPGNYPGGDTPTPDINATPTGYPPP